jgi:multiple sugar transport system permease protein
MRQSRLHHILRTAFWFLLTSLCVVVLLFPVYWMIVTSLKPNVEVFKNPPTLLPKAPTLEAYRLVLSDKEYLRYFGNSYLVASMVSLLTVMLGGLAGYGFSRFRMKGGTVLLLSVLLLMLFPRVVLIVPFFSIFASLRLYNTYIALIVANTSFALPFSIWMLKGYFDSVPPSMEEAAMVDGCTRLQAVQKISLVMALPGVVATAVYAFLETWNEYLFGLLLTKSYLRSPITVGIGQFFGQFTMNWNVIMAISVMASVPLIIVFIFLQRYLIAGMTAGALKQ